MRTRRGTVLGSTFTLLAVPVLAACSGNAEDDVRAAAEAFLADWAAGDTGGAAGTAAVVEYARTAIAPVVSLYVNDFNTTARAAYARVGFREVGQYASVLF